MIRNEKCTHEWTAGGFRTSLNPACDLGNSIEIQDINLNLPSSYIEVTHIQNTCIATLSCFLPNLYRRELLPSGKKQIPFIACWMTGAKKNSQTMDVTSHQISPVTFLPVPRHLCVLYSWCENILLRRQLWSYSSDLVGLQWSHPAI